MQTAHKNKQPRLRVVFADRGVGQQHAEQLNAIFEEPLLNPGEAARRLGVSVGTLSVWRCTKRYPLRYIKVGSRVRYDARDIASFEAWRGKER